MVDRDPPRAHAKDQPTSAPGRLAPRTVHVLIVCIALVAPAAGVLLTFLEVFRDGLGGVEGLAGSSAVSVSATGDQVYATGRLDDALVVFDRDATADALAFREAFVDGVDGVGGLAGAAGVASSRELRNIYVASAHSLAVFRRDATADAIAFSLHLQDGVGGVFGLNGASSVAVSPDDVHVLVTADLDDALTLFRRDGSSDALAFVDVAVDGSGGVFGLGGAADAAFSADGRNVYVAASGDSALAVFRRDASVDDLAFLQAHVDAADGVYGLGGAGGVAASPDGKHVYVTGRSDDSLAVFEVVSAQGELGFVVAYGDGQPGIDALDGASAVVVSPDGRYVIVAAADEDAVSIFRRYPEDGTLTQAAVLRDGENGVDGLDGAIALAVSPSALHVYVAAEGENAISSFRNALILKLETFEDGSLDAWNRAIP